MKNHKCDMRNDKLPFGQRGVALVLVLLMVSILVVLVLETVRAMQVEGASSRHFKDSLQAEGLLPRLVHIRLQMAGDKSRLFTTSVAIRRQEEEGGGQQTAGS